MENMKAALFGGKAGFRIVELPKPVIEPNAVVIHVKASGICGSDLRRYSNPEWAEELPAGHEVSGEIAEISPGMAVLQVGT